MAHDLEGGIVLARLKVALSKMPELDHFPNRVEGEAFNLKESEVLGWVLENEDMLRLVWEKVRRSGMIVYDPVCRHWHGIETEKGQELYAAKKAAREKTIMAVRGLDEMAREIGEVEDGKVRKPGRPVAFALDANVGGFVDGCLKSGESLSAICRRLAKFVTDQGIPMSSGGTARRAIYRMVKEGKLSKTANGRYVREEQVIQSAPPTVTPKQASEPNSAGWTQTLPPTVIARQQVAKPETVPEGFDVGEKGPGEVPAPVIHDAQTAWAALNAGFAPPGGVVEAPGHSCPTCKVRLDRELTCPSCAVEFAIIDGLLALAPAAGPNVPRGTIGGGS